MKCALLLSPPWGRSEVGSSLFGVPSRYFGMDYHNDDVTSTPTVARPDSGDIQSEEFADTSITIS